MDHSMEEAEKLFKIIDTDDGGELEFEEFVGFIVMLKKGDSRLAQFSNVLDNLKNTPLGALENQCKARGLKMRFITLEERPGTSQQAAAFVVELQIAGHFVSLEDGVLVDKFEVRKSSDSKPKNCSFLVSLEYFDFKLIKVMNNLILVVYVNLVLNKILDIYNKLKELEK